MMAWGRGVKYKEARWWVHERLTQDRDPRFQLRRKWLVDKMEPIDDNQSVYQR